MKTLGASYLFHEARNGHRGLDLARSTLFDCILLDYNLPDMTGFEVLAELRRHQGPSAPVVIFTGEGNESLAVEAMKLGAHDYLPKAQLRPDTLARAIANAIEKSSLQRKLADAQQNLEHLALYDALTGLGNRNLFHRELARAIAVAKRHETSFPLLVMDLDKFKAANDEFGHEAGDAILTAVGFRLQGISRAADAYFRQGGDEFTAILEAGSDGKVAAQRILEVVAQPVTFGPHVLDVRVSIGVAIYPTDGANAAAIVHAADRAMYEAKKLDVGWAAVGG